MELTGEVPDPMPCLYAVVYCSPTDAHLQSVHADRAKAIKCCDDLAAKMRAWRRKFFNEKDKAAAYCVIQIPVLHGSRV